MQYQRIGYGIKGFYRVANSGHLCTMTSKDAQHRFDIVTFHARHGRAATLDAFGISGRTLYRWRHILQHHGGTPAALTPRSCAPKRPSISTIGRIIARAPIKCAMRRIASPPQATPNPCTNPRKRAPPQATASNHP